MACDLGISGTSLTSADLRIGYQLVQVLRLRTILRSIPLAHRELVGERCTGEGIVKGKLC